jgi:2-polyprenyl-3-methyl-5-hydroxy-6-metoxy-1,4-benzoquinol methylase
MSATALYLPSEAQLYEHLRNLWRDHEKMLRDRPRNRAFLQALQQRVKPGSIVLDIGAGQGIWAITAAKLGAKYVLAVDTDELLLGLIKRLARENGVGDIVFPRCGYSTSLQLEREFDVVVSEIIGVHGFDENIVQVLHDARERFLKPGGALITEQLSLHVALGRIAEPLSQPEASSLNFAHFAELGQSVPMPWTKRGQVELLSPPRRLINRELLSDSSPLHLDSLRARWRLSAPVHANCFVVWFRSRLAPDCTLSSRQTSSWRPVIYRIASDSPAREFDLELAYLASGAQWQVRRDGGCVEHYSLRGACTSLITELVHCGEPVSAVGMGLFAGISARINS